MTLYGYTRVSVREPEDKNLDLQVERLVRAGCALGNIRAEEASRAKDDRDGFSLVLVFSRGGLNRSKPHFRTKPNRGPLYVHKPHWYARRQLDGWFTLAPVSAC